MFVKLLNKIVGGADRQGGGGECGQVCRYFGLAAQLWH